MHVVVVSEIGANVGTLWLGCINALVDVCSVLLCSG